MIQFLVGALLIAACLQPANAQLKNKTFLGVKIGEPLSLPRCSDVIKMQCHLHVETMSEVGVTATRIIPPPTGLDNLTVVYMKDNRVIRVEFRTLNESDIREAVALLYGQPSQKHPYQNWVWDGKDVIIEADRQGVVRIDCKRARKQGELRSV
jgi:hypothetical protein